MEDCAGGRTIVAAVYRFGISTREHRHQDCRAQGETQDESLVAGH